MKQDIYKRVEVDIKYLQVDLFRFYLEDSTINGKEGNESNTPFYCQKYNQYYDEDRPCISFTIDVDEGKILNYPIGTIWNIRYKAVDEGIYTLTDKDYNEISKLDGYVPNVFSIDDAGYGDYIFMTVDENGYIQNWVFHFEDFPGFTKENEDY